MREAPVPKESRIGAMTLERLRIYLFGEPRFELRGEAYRFSAPPKTLPLLAYLLLHRRGPVARETLATLLWPDADQETAFTNLRRHLHYLSKALPPARSGVPWVAASKALVAWNLESPYWLDVEAFETEIQERHLRAHAVRLYSGDLYERCGEEWIEFERERLRTLQISNLAQLCADAQKRSSYVEALQYAQLMLAADPWREDALRTIVETRMLLGDRAGALAEYERFASRLAEELHTQPLAETVRVYERIQRSAGAGSTAALSAHSRASTLIGRRNELATLRAEWQRASRGEGRAVFVGGEAGIGKTALLEALRESVAETAGSILALAASPDADAAYAAFLGAAHEAGVDLGSPVSSDDERLRIFEAFACALEERARETPLLVSIEDLHWASGATLDLLRYLILRLSTAPVLFLGTYREFEVHRAHPLRALRRQLAKMHRCMTLALGALSREDVRELAALRAGRELADELVQRIYQRSDGNPLFVSEIVRELRGADQEAVPSSIAEIVRGRLARLAVRSRSVLQTAAIAGSTLSAELLVQVSGLREADAMQILDELVAAHFLRQSAGDAFSFVHEVIREALYAGIAHDTARATHARIGFALRELHADRFEDIAAAVARHFEYGGIEEPACDAYLVAAEHALSVYAIDEAASYAQKAFERAPETNALYRALRVLETVAGLRADRRTQRALLDRLLELRDRLDDDENADILLRDIDFTSGEPPDAQRAALQRFEDIAARVPARLAAYLLRRGEYLSRVGEVHDAKAVLGQALERLSNGNDADALLRCLSALYIVTLSTGEPLDELERQVAAARANLEHRVDARVSARLEFIQSASIMDRDPARAASFAALMLEHARNAGDVWLEALAHRAGGACATRLMQLGSARAHFNRSAEITIAAGRLRDLARLRSWQVMLENRCANFAAANRYGQEGLEAAHASGAADLIASIHGNLANTAVWAGDLDAAEAHLCESLHLGEQRGFVHPSISSLLGEVLVGKGDLDAGIQTIERAREASAPQDDALGTLRVHYPLLLAIAYAAAGREGDARRCAQGIRGELTAFRSYYIHPQIYLWSAGQLLALLGYEESAAFLDAARGRKEAIAATIGDETSRATFGDFIFNRLIDRNARVENPLHAWFLPYEARAAATA